MLRRILDTLLGDIAGADITEFGKPPQGPDFNAVLNMIEAAGKPVVAAIHGTALGDAEMTTIEPAWKMLLADKRGAAPWQVIGTDLSTAMVESAQRALFPLERARMVPPEYLKRHCQIGRAHV